MRFFETASTFVLILVSLPAQTGPVANCAGCGTVASFGTGGRDCSATEHRLSITGCAAPGGTVEVAARVGSWIQLPIVLFVGASDRSWGNVTLPFDLTPFGAPGNSIYVSLDENLAQIPNAGGGGKIRLTIPKAAGLSNQTVFFQSILVGCGANALRLVLSNGVKVTIG